MFKKESQDKVSQLTKEKIVCFHYLCYLTLVLFNFWFIYIYHEYLMEIILIILQFPIFIHSHVKIYAPVTLFIQCYNVIVVSHSCYIIVKKIIRIMHNTCVLINKKYIKKWCKISILLESYFLI